jgi:RNA polymerase sigma factor for flagellar operon FliA
MVDIADLINDGYLGLLDATRFFDATRGVCFERYARRRIRGAMLDGLRGRAWVPRLIRKETNPRVLIGKPFDDALEELIDLSPTSDFVPEPEERQQVYRLVTTLPRRSRQVMHLYFFEEHSMKEIGSILGVSEARVSQIRSRAIEKLREQTQRLAA